MVKCRSRKHQTINKSNRYTNIDPLCECLQHPTGLRAMDVKIVIDARVTGRYDERLTIDYKTNVTDETFVENGIDRFAIEVSAFR